MSISKEQATPAPLTVPGNKLRSQVPLAIGCCLQYGHVALRLRYAAAAAAALHQKSVLADAAVAY